MPELVDRHSAPGAEGGEPSGLDSVYAGPVVAVPGVRQDFALALVFAEEYKGGEPLSREGFCRRLRPDEAARLEFRDVEIVDDDPSGERILEIKVRGKRGVGYCKSMPGAVLPFDRLRDRLRAKDEAGLAEGRRSVSADKPVDEPAEKGKAKTVVRAKPKSTDRLFPQTHRELFNLILAEEDLKEDRDGQRRTAYSLRHAYICMRLMEGADIYQVAKNCRTSFEMIETYYASHLKSTLGASAINVRRPKKTKAKKQKTTRYEE
ncbi:MAG TPA: hypothetical protein VFE10_15540 [Phenylobacterium sp.]|nr:hypothetical protein [Phenylobacterium sp.]